MNIRFDNVIVAITGAAHGLGRAMARDFANLGARVFACDVSAENLAETAIDTSMRTDAFDLTAPGAARAWIAQVEREVGGPVGVLVSNAGGVRGQKVQPIDDVSEEDWHAIVDVNLHACFNLCSAVAAGMKAAGTGAIVTISSTAGLSRSLTGIQAYCAAKHGLVGLTRQLAHELGPHGIRVNSVAPGFIPSNAASLAQFESYGAAGQQHLIDAIALRRLGDVRDISDAVLFLASDRARWITGEVLAVSGGM